MTTPSAPRATTLPSKSGSPRLTVRRLAVRADEVEGGDGRCERAVLDPRAVRAGGDGTRDGDVRERGEVAERPPRRLRLGRHLAVCRMARHAGGAARRVDDDGGRQVDERDEHGAVGIRDVGEVGEFVPRPEGADARRRRDEAPAGARPSAPARSGTGRCGCRPSWSPPWPQSARDRGPRPDGLRPGGAGGAAVLVEARGARPRAGSSGSAPSPGRATPQPSGVIVSTGGLPTRWERSAPSGWSRRACSVSSRCLLRDSLESRPARRGPTTSRPMTRITTTASMTMSPTRSPMGTSGVRCVTPDGTPVGSA